MGPPISNKAHVYFGSEDCAPKDNSIVVKQHQLGFIQIHLGFLQYHHIYNLRVEIPKCFLLECDIPKIMRGAEHGPPNVNCKVISIEEQQNAFVFLIEFHAEKEGLVKETLKLCFGNESPIILELNARVLGTGKGTPLLKNGIKCIGVLSDELSEASDWRE